MGDQNKNPALPTIVLLTTQSVAAFFSLFNAICWMAGAAALLASPNDTLRLLVQFVIKVPWWLFPAILFLSTIALIVTIHRAFRAIYTYQAQKAEIARLSAKVDDWSREQERKIDEWIAHGTTAWNEFRTEVTQGLLARSFAIGALVKAEFVKSVEGLITDRIEQLQSAMTSFAELSRNPGVVDGEWERAADRIETLYACPEGDGWFMAAESLFGPLRDDKIPEVDTDGILVDREQYVRIYADLLNRRNGYRRWLSRRASQIQDGCRNNLINDPRQWEGIPSP